MKKDRLRVALIISPDIQDKYFASTLVEHFNIIGIFVEPQYRHQTAGERLTKALYFCFKNNFNPVSLIKRFSDEVYYRNYKKRAVNLFMGSFYEKGRGIDTYQGCPVYYTGIKDVSSPHNVDLLKNLEPDVIAVCGCSILKKNLLAVPPLGTINLHSGLAPYYRGCSCFFWPLYNNELQYLGITIHYVSAGIDDGDIIHQGRPELQEDDDELTIFVKIMKLGTELMIKTISEIETGTIKSYKQTEKGKLYLDSSTTVDHFRELHKKLEKGLIRNYLKKQEINNVKPKIIE